MSYNVVFTDEAQSDFDRLPAQVASWLLDQLDLLATSPTTYSRRVHFPYRNVGQLFPCRIEMGGRHWSLDVAFVYGTDEQTLFLLYIATRAVPPL